MEFILADIEANVFDAVTVSNLSQSVGLFVLAEWSATRK
jgi:hypothetical protein